MRCLRERCALSGVYGAQNQPPANQNRRLNHSPIDTLIDLLVGGRLHRLIPVGCPVELDRNTPTDVRIAVTPQRWPARQGHVR